MTNHIVVFRVRSISVGLILLVLSLAFLMSCDEVERHKILTYFFDGVPPLAPEQATIQDLAERHPQELTPAAPNAIWYVHEPRKDCALCHGKRRRRGLSLQVHLTAAVPKLCYNCHADYTMSAYFVHGPVATGQCLFCHNPHKSKIEYLLIEPQPGLCYLCHDVSAIQSIPGHFAERLSKCTNCHSVHASPVKYLLKTASPQMNEEEKLDLANAVGTVLQDYIQTKKDRYEKGKFGQTENAHVTAPPSKNLFQLFWTASKLIEQGQLRKARAYLQEAKENNTFTCEEQEKIAQVLRLIEIQLNKQWNKDKAHHEKIRQARFVTAQKVDNQQDKRSREIAELYYRSIESYRHGRLEKAQAGFIKVLKSGLVPAPLAKAIESYLMDINNTLASRAEPLSPER